jgi:iron-sulfur cluster assembly accessory protein
MTTTMIEPIEVIDVAPVVTLTPTAAVKLQQILLEKNLPDHGLRVFVAGGGCSGLQYGMAFEGEPRDMDTIFEAHGLKVYVDPVSLEYLSGASIDYVDGLMGAGFRIENPNAVSACGCGSSFRTKGSGEAPAGGSCGCGN